MSADPALDDVVQLMEAATGVVPMPPRLADSALAVWRREAGEESVDQVLDAFRSGGLDAVRRGSDVDSVRSLARFLYVGRWSSATGEDETGPDPVSDHFESLVWRVVQAHPPALSGGYFGHWHYPPEDDALI